MECPRKTSFRKVLHLRTPTAKSAELGLKGHWTAERFLTNGTLNHSPGWAEARAYLGPGPWSPSHVEETLVGLTEAVKIMEPGLGYLPSGPGVKVEQEFTFEAGRLCFIGYRDFTVGPRDRPEGVPLVGDHKTTSDFKYIKGPDVLMWDPQAVLYGYYALLESKCLEVDLLWVYYRTRGARKAEPVRLRLHKDHLVPAFQALQEVAREVQTIIDDGILPADLPPNLTACGMYGGCPYREQCHETLTGLQRIQATMSANPKLDSILNRAKARQAQLQGQVGGLPATDTAKNPAPEAKASLPEASPSAGQEPKAGPLTATGTTFPPPPVSQIRVMDVPEGAPALTVDAPRGEIVDLGGSVSKSISAPGTGADVDLDFWSPEAVRVRTQALYATTDAQPINPPEYMTPAQGDALEAESKAPKSRGGAAPASGADTPKKRGRPAGSKNKSAAVEAHLDAACGRIADEILATELAKVYGLEERAPVAQAPAEVLEAPESSTLQGYVDRTLYVDCVPEGVAVTSAESLYRQAQAKVAAMTGNPAHVDYRLIDYGKGAPVFVAALTEVLEAQDGPLAVVVSSASDEARVAMVAFRAWATVVVRGTR